MSDAEREPLDGAEVLWRRVHHTQWVPDSVTGEHRLVDPNAAWHNAVYSAQRILDGDASATPDMAEAIVAPKEVSVIRLTAVVIRDTIPL